MNIKRTIVDTSNMSDGKPAIRIVFHGIADDGRPTMMWVAYSPEDASLLRDGLSVCIAKTQAHRPIIFDSNVNT